MMCYLLSCLRIHFLASEIMYVYVRIQLESNLVEHSEGSASSFQRAGSNKFLYSLRGR